MRLRTAIHGREPQPSDREPGCRRLHAIPRGTLSPLCGEAHLPLLPTFTTWTTAVPPGVNRCEACTSLSPRACSRLPYPRLGRWLLADGTRPQWTYTISASLRWAMIVAASGITIGLLISIPLESHPGDWVASVNMIVGVGLFLCGWLRLRLSVGQDGVTAVDLFRRRRSFLWNDISRFDAKQGQDGKTLMLILQDGRAIALPCLNTKSLSEQERRADVLNRLFGLGEYSARAVNVNSAEVLAGVVGPAPGEDHSGRDGPQEMQDAVPPGWLDEAHDAVPVASLHGGTAAPEPGPPGADASRSARMRPTGEGDSDGQSAKDRTGYKEVLASCWYARLGLALAAWAITMIDAVNARTSRIKMVGVTTTGIVIRADRRVPTRATAI
jgi:hypothetical protein